MKKIKRGSPIQELVKGSSEYTMRMIRRAFYSQHPDTRDEYFWVVETFDDHIIVNSDQLNVDEFYLVTYATVDGEFVFAARDEWQTVELAYQPISIEERLRESKGSRITVVSERRARLSEAKDGQPRTLFVNVAEADEINLNSRRYSQEVLIEAAAEARQHLHESFSQGRASIVGEEDHPPDKRQRPRLTETIVVWKDIWFDHDSGWVKAEGEMIENSHGRDAIVTMDAGVMPGVSLRGFGESEFIKENGRRVENLLWLRFTAIDIVMEPGFEEAGVTALESFKGDDGIMATKDKKPKEEAPPGVDFSKLTVVELRQFRPDLFKEAVTLSVAEEEEQLRKVQEVKAAKEAELLEFSAGREAELRESLGISETEDLPTAMAERQAKLDKLERAEQAREVSAYIQEQVENIQYPDFMKEQLVTAVGQPLTIEEAKDALKTQRGIFDKIVSEMRLAAKGMHGEDILGPVLEGNSNVPAHARAAHFINESLRDRNVATTPPPKEGRRLTIQEQLCAKYLEIYDKLYKTQLLREAREFEEAELTTDLNLPYSVMRSVIEQAFPMLIAPVIFDYALSKQSPDRVYFEQYVGETGEQATVTSASVVTNHDTWDDIGNGRLIPGTVVVKNVGATITYVFGTDYTINYATGKIYSLSGGAMADATAHEFTYDYKAYRKGEMGAIERGKMQTVFQTLEHAADRLAQQISREAVVFSRSQLGWDAHARTINTLVKELVKKIDGDYLWEGLSAALTVPNNSGGTWVSASNPVVELVEKIGVAKVKVANREYEPTFILVSKTRSDTLSNWDGFTAAGKRPSDDLNANGYVGRLKGLPVFESTQFTDAYVLIGNKELVMMRVFQAMQIFGPFPTYDSNGKMIAAQQFYIEEFNGSLAPVPGKGSYVEIT